MQIKKKKNVNIKNDIVFPKEITALLITGPSIFIKINLIFLNYLIEYKICKLMKKRYGW